ncbi:unnamed protein product [Rotaria magnacalcarata]|uniref:Uncharacterized protein n=1 Tax=Rotaria magnacalcarata TaxID=392030 RepID=A0A814Y420_9BILA|nr:unnamed protein product [Rotaria magnacalcarata]CAF4115272.1 unnamed protein product [Rotaria magnacalcarata]
MSSIPTYRGSTSQRFATTATNSSQQHYSSQHQNYSTQPPSSEAGSFFGPMRSSLANNQPQTLQSPYSQRRAQPYTTNSPRVIRRQPDISFDEADIQDDHDRSENECILAPPPVTLQRSTLEKLLGRLDTLGNEMSTLQTKTDKLLKMFLVSSRKEQEMATTRPKSKPNPILWENQNLLEKGRTPLPTTYMCHLVRKMYSADEIKNKVPQLPPKEGDERLNKIKECLITLYFSHDPSLIDEFMSTKGHDSLYGQERTKKAVISKWSLQEELQLAKSRKNNKNIGDNNIINDLSSIYVNSQFQTRNDDYEQFHN